RSSVEDVVRTRPASAPLPRLTPTRARRVGVVAQRARVKVHPPLQVPSIVSASTTVPTQPDTEPPPNCTSSPLTAPSVGMPIDIAPYEIVSRHPLTWTSHGVSIPGQAPFQAQSVPGLTAEQVPVVVRGVVAAVSAVAVVLSVVSEVVPLSVVEGVPLSVVD